MQGKHIFEYAVIRVVPRVEREEFLNVGVILYCPEKNFLKTKCELNEEKFSLFADDDLDFEDLEKRMKAFEQICEGKIEAGENW
jgi:predicted AAA+ superfamily ATPase